MVVVNLGGERRSLNQSSVLMLWKRLWKWQVSIGWLDVMWIVIIYRHRGKIETPNCFETVGLVFVIIILFVIIMHIYLLRYCSTYSTYCTVCTLRTWNTGLGWEEGGSAFTMDLFRWLSFLASFYLFIWSAILSLALSMVLYLLALPSHLPAVKTLTYAQTCTNSVGRQLLDRIHRTQGQIYVLTKINKNRHTPWN